MSKLPRTDGKKDVQVRYETVFVQTKTLLPRNKKDITARHGCNCHVCGPWLDLCLERFVCACYAHKTIISWGVIVLLSQKLLHSIVLFESWRAARGLFYYSGNCNYQLHFPLPAFFLSDTETSQSDVTMRVISFDLSHTLTAKPAALTLIQCTSCNELPKTGCKQAETTLSFLQASENIWN